MVSEPAKKPERLKRFLEVTGLAEFGQSIGIGRKSSPSNGSLQNPVGGESYDPDGRLKKITDEIEAAVITPLAIADKKKAPVINALQSTVRLAAAFIERNPGFDMDNSQTFQRRLAEFADALETAGVDRIKSQEAAIAVVAALKEKLKSPAGKAPQQPEDQTVPEAPKAEAALVAQATVSRRLVLLERQHAASLRGLKTVASGIVARLGLPADRVATVQAAIEPLIMAKFRARHAVEAEHTAAVADADTKTNDLRQALIVADPATAEANASRLLRLIDAQLGFGQAR